MDQSLYVVILNGLIMLCAVNGLVTDLPPIQIGIELFIELWLKKLLLKSLELPMSIIIGKVLRNEKVIFKTTYPYL